MSGYPAWFSLRFEPVYGAHTLGLSGFALDCVDPASLSDVMPGQRRPVSLGEIAAVLEGDTVAGLLDAGYFLRLRIDGALLVDPDWSTTLRRELEREAGDLGLQLVVAAGQVDPNATRLEARLEELRTSNAGVVVELERRFRLDAAELETLERLGVAGILGEVDMLCQLAVLGSGNRILGDASDRASSLTLSAERIRTTRELEIARALRCAYVSGPLFGSPVDSSEAVHFLRFAAWGGGVRGI